MRYDRRSLLAIALFLIASGVGNPGSVCEQGSEDVDPAELHFLLLHFLSAGPCQSAAKVLEEEAVAKGLLPSRTDIFGAHADLHSRSQYVI